MTVFVYVNTSAPGDRTTSRCSQMSTPRILARSCRTGMSAPRGRDLGQTGHDADS
jgi:hypothetical protein